MSYPESIGAANGVLRAAEAWRDAIIPNTSSAPYPERAALVDAIDRYRVAALKPHEQTTDTYR